MLRATASFPQALRIRFRRRGAEPNLERVTDAASSAQQARPFVVGAFLARVATTNTAGAPAVRAVWFLWEEAALWWISGERG